MGSASPEQPEEHSDEVLSFPERASGVSTRAVWYAVGIIAVVGVAVIAALALGWRTGRVSGVGSVSFGQEGQIAAHAGSLPTGGRAPLRSPRSVSTDGSLVYVTEPDDARVSVFDLDGRFVRELEIRAEGRVYPVDAVALRDTLYVADSAGKRLLALPSDGGVARTIAPRIQQPTALAEDDGMLLIADASNGIWRLQPGSMALELIAGAAATKGFAGGLAVSDGRLLVSDAGGSRVLDVGVPGGDVAAFGSRIDLPRGVAVDAAGRVWVSDVFGGVVKVFDGSGEPLGDLEDGIVTGAAAVRIESPQGLAFAPTEDRLFVVDSAGGLVQIFAVEK